MKMLAIEFSTDQRSVAALADGRVLGVALETATRTTHAFALISQALAEAGWEREDVAGIALGLGPGSYAGIRSSISLAQGWQFAVGADRLKLLGISSVACLAAEAQAQGCFGKVNIVLDAQRNEVYLAGYEIDAIQCREVQPLKLATLDEARSRFAAGELLVGPEVNRWFEAGRILFPSAAMLGRLATARTDFVPGEMLEPIYLRETAFVKAPPLRVLPQ